MAAAPILYSFRRCPYAMRARLALAVAGLRVELREVRLRDKPAALLAASPKGTVPVLHCPDGRVLEESIDIMHWALDQADPLQWRRADRAADTAALIAACDQGFKPWLDRYKYFDRHPDQPRAAYAAACAEYLGDWDARIAAQGGGLLGARPTLADHALLPFVRQYARSDAAAFAALPYPALQAWLAAYERSPLAARIMPKWPVWAGDAPGPLIDWSEADAQPPR